jgi:hypothetical protein
LHQNFLPQRQNDVSKVKMIVSGLVSSGAFSPLGVNDSQRVKPSSLLISKSQRERIQSRNQAATSRHVTQNRNQEQNSMKSTGETEKRTRTIRSSSKPENLSPKIDKPKLRDLKEKELVAKLAYLKKLQDKDHEV